MSTRVFVAERPEEIPAMRRAFYSLLARFFLKQVGSKTRTVLEAGSGKGQLTFPLLQRLPRNTRFLATDSSTGSYKGSFEEFRVKLKARTRSHMVTAIKSDVRRIRGIKDSSVDAVVSNELLCDLRDKRQLGSAFREFYRVLRPGGVMVHGEWSSWPSNQSQAIAIKADSPVGTNTPSRFWNPDELFIAAKDAGFAEFTATYFKTTMRLEYPAAVAELRNWGVKETFLKRNNAQLHRYGIELPFEHLVRCTKPVKPQKTKPFGPRSWLRREVWAKSRQTSHGPTLRRQTLPLGRPNPNRS